MGEITNDSASFLAATHVLLLWVRTKDMIRKRAKRLMEHGVTQKAIAASMGMSTATFSRWVNDDENVKITTDALDGFYEYEHTLRVLLGPEPDHAHQVRDPAIRKRESSEETALKKRARST